MINYDKCGYYEIKNSKFFGYFFEISNESQIQEYLTQVRNEHKKSTHTCYAVILQSDNFICKCFDDKEPSGTAGRPILSVIEKNNLKNCMIVVVRYFGGIKLGGGGLVRAYTKIASETLKG